MSPGQFCTTKSGKPDTRHHCDSTSLASLLATDTRHSYAVSIAKVEAVCRQIHKIEAVCTDTKCYHAAYNSQLC